MCEKVAGAYCRPGMKGCVLVGKVKFQDGAVPEPQWPPEKAPKRPLPDDGGAQRGR